MKITTELVVNVFQEVFPQSSCWAGRPSGRRGGWERLYGEPVSTAAEYTPTWGQDTDPVSPTPRGLGQPHGVYSR